MGLEIGQTLQLYLNLTTTLTAVMENYNAISPSLGL
jgi:hypothetical protein